YQRDERVKFYPEPHIYEIDGIIADSATTIISKFFPEFDPDYVIYKMKNGKNWGPNNKYFRMSNQEIKDGWNKKGNIALEKGSLLHEQIENFYLQKEYQETEVFYQFKEFFNDYKLKPYRSEWRIFDDNYQIAGTIDLIVKKGNKYELYDWKRSKKVVRVDGTPIEINNWQQGIGKLSHIDDTSYNRYCLQQNLYRYILEENYDLKIDSMNLVIFHPNYERYYKVTVPAYKNEINYILQTL